MGKSFHKLTAGTGQLSQRVAQRCLRLTLVIKHSQEPGKLGFEVAKSPQAGSLATEMIQSPLE
jgi:hypothetical protein